MLGAASAFAEPGFNRRDARETVRAYHIQSVTLERNIPRDHGQAVPQDRRRPGEGAPESSGFGSSGDGQSHGAQSTTQQAENARRQGRMTPEERRTLRRQIDEVGHDIYAPKR